MAATCDWREFSRFFRSKDLIINGLADRVGSSSQFHSFTETVKALHVEGLTYLF